MEKKMIFLKDSLMIKISLQKKAAREKNENKKALKTLNMTPEEFIKSYNRD